MSPNFIIRLFTNLILMILSSGHAALVPCENDVIKVGERRILPQFWTNKLENQNALLMTGKSVKIFNQKMLVDNEFVKDPLSFPESLDKNNLTSMISSITNVTESDRFYTNGKKLTEEDFEEFINNTNLHKIEDSNPVRFGIIVHRSDLRFFPTADRVVASNLDNDLDYFRETALFPGEPVAVLLESLDKKWYLVRNYNCLGWVQQDSVALGKKEEIRRFQEAEPFVIVTGDKVFTSYVPDAPQLSQIQLDMGTRLPLLTENNLPEEIYGQNTYTSYVVLFPVRDQHGNLNFTEAMIPRHQDINIGYLPFNRGNIIRQSFKFLGERYGWGDDYNGRDCSGFVRDVYKTFGILIPRNTGEQAASSYGINYRFHQNSTKDDKLNVVKQLDVGDLIYIPGHVVLFLGHDLDRPYVIHDVKGVGYVKCDGSHAKKSLNAVFVSPLLSIYKNMTSYVDIIYDIKRIRAV